MSLQDKYRDYFGSREILYNLTKHLKDLLQTVDEIREKSESGCKNPNHLELFTVLHSSNMLLSSQFDYCCSMMKESQKNTEEFAKIMEEYKANRGY